jgi:tetratricopeptide (TPR) repeat protein
MQELWVPCFGPPPTAALLEAIDAGDVAGVDPPPEPWPEGFSCELFFPERSVRGVTVAWEADALRVRLLPFASEDDWELARRIATAAAALLEAPIHVGDEPQAVLAKDLPSACAALRRDFDGVDMKKLEEFLNDEDAPAILSGLFRNIVVGPRVWGELVSAGPRPELLERLQDLIRRVQFATGDGIYHPVTPVWNEQEDRRYAVVPFTFEVSYLFPHVDLVAFLDPRKVLEPCLIPYAGVLTLLDGWIRYLDEVQVYVPALSQEQWERLRECALECKTSPNPEGALEDCEFSLGAPPLLETLAPRDALDQRIRAYQIRAQLTKEAGAVRPLGESHEERGDLVREHDPAAALADYNEAVRHYAKGAREDDECRALLGVAYAKRGDVSHRLGTHNDAHSDYERADTILRRELVRVAWAKHSLIVLTRSRVEALLERNEREQALSVVQATLDLALGLGAEGLATAHLLRAEVYGDDVLPATTDLLRAIELLGGLKDFDHGAPQRVAWVVSSLLQRLVLCDNALLLEATRKSSNLLIALGGRGEVSVSTLAEVCTLWQLSLTSLGHYDEAIAVCRRTAECMEATLAADEDAGAPGWLSVARVRAELADVLCDQRRFPDARLACDEALSLHERALSDGASDPDASFELYMTAAEISLIDLDPHASLEYTDAASRLLGKLRGQHAVDPGRALQGRGEVLLAQGDPAGALEFFRQALTYLEQMEHPVGREGASAVQRALIGHAHLELGSTQEAVAELSAGLEVLERHLREGVCFGELGLVVGLAALGEALWQEGETQAAREAWSRAEVHASHARARGVLVGGEQAEIERRRARCLSRSDDDQGQDRQEADAAFTAARELLVDPPRPARLMRLARDHVRMAPQDALHVVVAAINALPDAPSSLHEDWTRKLLAEAADALELPEELLARARKCLSEA